MQNLPVLSDSLILHCLPFLMPDVRVWVQLAAANFGIFAGLAALENLGFLVLFEAVLLWALVHPQSVSTLVFLILFEAFLWQVLVHPQYYTLLYILLQVLVHCLSTQGFSFFSCRSCSSSELPEPVSTNLGIFGAF